MHTGDPIRGLLLPGQARTWQATLFGLCESPVVALTAQPTSLEELAEAGVQALRNFDVLSLLLLLAPGILLAPAEDAASARAAAAMAALELPAALDGSTLDVLMTQFDRGLYPRPSSGFAARMGVLMGLTGAFMAAAGLYLVLSARCSEDGSKRKSLWLVRRVERPSGRFIVLNLRCALPTALCIYGVWGLIFLGSFYRVYAEQDPQYLWVVARVYNALFLFISGWLVSFSGLQAFLVAAESHDSRFLSARSADLLFLLGGGILFLLHLALGIVNIILDFDVLNRADDLRNTVVTLRASLNGRTPTLLDLLPLQAPAEALAGALDRAHGPGTAQIGLDILLALSCALVNLGGLALARRLHLQIQESLELLALVNPDKPLAPPIASPTIVRPLLRVPALSTTGSDASSDKPSGAQRERQDSGVTSRSSLLMQPACPPEPGWAVFSDPWAGPLASVPVVAPGRRRSSAAPFSAVADAGMTERRRPSMTLVELKLLARRGSEKGVENPAREQARKVLELKKAERDLVTITSTVLVVTTLIMAALCYITYATASNAVTSGSWATLELCATLCNWIYAVFSLGAVSYLIWNMLTHRISSASRSALSSRTTSTSTWSSTPHASFAIQMSELAASGACAPGTRSFAAHRQSRSKRSFPSLPRLDLEKASLSLPGSRRSSLRSPTATSVLVSVETLQTTEEEDELGRLWWDKVESKRRWIQGRRESVEAWNEKLGIRRESEIATIGEGTLQEEQEEEEQEEEKEEVLQQALD